MSTVVFGWKQPVVCVRAPAAWTDSVTALFPHYVLQASRAPLTFDLLPAGEGGTLRTLDGEQRAGSGPELLGLLEYELMSVLLEAASEHAHLHASGAVVSGRGVLALGPSGAGKSSVAFAWHRLGMPLLGDETVLIDPAGSAHAFRRLIKLEADRARDGGVDPASTLGWDPESSEIWYPPGPGGWAEGLVPVAVVARVQYQAGAPLEMRAMSEAETLNVLMHSLQSGGASGPDALASLATLAESVVGLDVRFSDAVATAEALVSKVQRS